MEKDEHAFEKLEQAHAIIKDGIADTMDIYGVNRSVGQLYATLYLNDGPMTLDDLRDELGMSKGSMSIGVRKLLEEKIIHRVYRKGERKDLYEAEKDFFQFFISFFTRRWERERSVNLQAVKQAIPLYEALLDDAETPDEVRAEAAHTLKKITASLEYYEFLGLLVEQFQTGNLAKDLVERYKNENGTS
ncbi:GbsR/MarR family transcriptional regulator [Shouchella clausii]|jgi:HTH-type transcriptional regulator, glycine betaine synthesis regulator|uniref:GbsR/MarR family transcriptional regulator n=1 Tax=Shouchella clausii TaxID=79880 RepID=UPI000BA6862C|nr:GbsR/MarR family transcriptional regulator [Shouchella clausii]SPT81645.1 transcriptional regulator [Niallia circulans]MCM3548688.1 GbsR/MarR family transcriptional regulator [Shouchella clausii]PAD13689.1 GbsR/MarR family transcriptional regulator [Shouchella clausii]PAF13487.1 GbsR/MarR family transcriptional regulator [Shouchella clausii]PTL22153.1 GbsR/MarR family transcriptional regulator [Shouchella clausii]